MVLNELVFVSVHVFNIFDHSVVHWIFFLDYPDRRVFINHQLILNNIMEADALKRVEAKLDLVLDLLQDKNLTNEEIMLIKETDEHVRVRKLGEFTKL